jgi:hypothetical protein
MRSKLALLALSGSLVAAPVAFSTLVGGSGAGQQAFVVGASGAGRQAFALRASYSIPGCRSDNENGGYANNTGTCCGSGPNYSGNEPTGKCCRSDNENGGYANNTGTCCGGGPNYANSGNEPTASKVCVGDNNSGNSGKRRQFG